MTDDRDTDLDQLARLRSDVPPPDAAVLADARRRLELQDVRPAVLARRRRRTEPATRRRVLVGIGAAAAVAAIASGAFVLTGADGGRRGDRLANPGPSVASGSTDGATSPASPSATSVVHFANAAQLLDAAAAGASRDSGSLPAGRYRHVTNHNYSITTIEEPPHDGAYQLTENRNESWTPASGISYQRNDNNIAVRYPTAEQRRFAKRSPGGIPQRELTWYSIAENGSSTQLYPTHQREPDAVPCSNCADGSVWDSAASADPASFPSNSGELRRTLYAWAKKTYRELVGYGKGDQFTVDDLAYDALTDAVSRPELPGGLRAALYQVIKTVPGITLIRSLANYDGSVGIAVGRVDVFHVEHDLIFTDNGSTFIGDRTIARKPSRLYDVGANTLVGASAVTVNITGKPTVPAPKR